VTPTCGLGPQRVVVGAGGVGPVSLIAARPPRSAAGGGTQSPYELNTTWYSALNRDDADEPQTLQVDRFVASSAIALVLRGVPGVFLPSLFGAKNDTAAILEGKDARAINRKTTDEEALFALLGDRESWVRQVAVRLRRLIKKRVGIPAFHPNAEQRVLFPAAGVFAVLRESRDGRQRVLALTNVTALEQRVRFAHGELGAWANVLDDRGRRCIGGSAAAPWPSRRRQPCGRGGRRRSREQARVVRGLGAGATRRATVDARPSAARAPRACVRQAGVRLRRRVHFGWLAGARETRPIRRSRSPNRGSERRTPARSLVM
jgi:hypothetical protein